MSTAALSLALVVATLGQNRFREAPTYGPIQKDELTYQQQNFKQWWGDDLVLKLADLPLEGRVPEYRVPYSGHDYPDQAGGTIVALSKYDQAFHAGRPIATNFERNDIGGHRGGRVESVGLFGRIRRSGTPGWYGHCNGWTAAAIRHAEPQKSVVRNGVTFTPADIKGLLAEMYMYTESEFLGGVDPAINPGTLHISLTNWIGRGSHPIGMETAIGEVVINFPIYSYASRVTKLSDRQSEVQMSIRYTVNAPRETDKQPKDFNRVLYFHYSLDTNEAGEITGGRYHGDSQQIDMLWTPLQPAQGGTEKNKRGNPHMNIKEVLAIWRESVPEDLRKKWMNIDPTEEDRILPAESVAATPTPAQGTAESTTSTGESATAPSSSTSVPATPPATPATPATGTPAPATPAPADSPANPS